MCGTYTRHFNPWAVKRRQGLKVARTKSGDLVAPLDSAVTLKSKNFNGTDNDPTVFYTNDRAPGQRFTPHQRNTDIVRRREMEKARKEREENRHLYGK